MALACKGGLGIGVRLKLLQSSKLLANVSLSGCQQVANLTSTGGQPGQRRKPWPYETRPYNSFYQYFDHTTKRLDDNSKVIVVDGNLAVGKSEFAEKLAKEFDLRYFPDFTDKDVFETASGFDIRQLDEQLPTSARHCDFEHFYLQNVPKNQLARIGNTQYQMYRSRYFQYADALNHVLNTGQGVVLERGVWSDMVFVETMKKLKYLTPAGYKFLKESRFYTICELWQPHLVVYLDAPLSYIKQQIKKRNVPHEVNSPILNDQFIEELDKNYKKVYLRDMKKCSEVLEYDVTDMLDWEIIVEDIERLNLDKCLEEDTEKFKKWQLQREDDWNSYRMDIARPQLKLNNFFKLPIPWDAKEMYWTGNDALELNNIVCNHPEVAYHPRYNPENFNHYFR